MQATTVRPMNLHHLIISQCADGGVIPEQWVSRANEKQSARLDPGSDADHPASRISASAGIFSKLKGKFN